MADTQDFILTHRVVGAVTVALGKPLVIPVPVELYGIYAVVGTAPTGAALIVNISKNGVQQFAGAARLSIAISGTAANKVEAAGVTPGANVITPSTPSAVPLVSFNALDTFSVDVDQVGSTVAGSDLGVTLFFIEK